MAFSKSDEGCHQNVETRDLAFGVGQPFLNEIARLPAPGWDNKAMNYQGTVQVSDHLLWLTRDPASFDALWPATGVPGFVHFAADTAIIKAGISDGKVDVTVDVLLERPSLDLDHGWLFI